MDGFPDVKLEGGVVSGDSLTAVHIDSGRSSFSLRLQKLRPVDFSELVLSLICRGRSGQGHRGSTTRCEFEQQWMLWHSLSQTGPPPSSLPTTWLRIVPIFDHEAFLPALVEHFGPGLQVVDEQEAVRLPGRFLVDGLQFLLGQQGRELLENGFQLELVAEAPDAHELHVHPDGGADEPQLLARDPGGDLHVAPADEERVQGPVPGAAVQLRLIGEVVDYYKNLEKLFEPQLLRLACEPLLLLDDSAQGPLVPLVEVDLLPVRVDAHVMFYEVLHGLPGIVDLNARRHDYDSFKDGLTAGCAVLVQNGRDQGHRLPGFARPQEDAGARHAGDDRVAWLFRGVFGGGEELHLSHLGSPRSPGTAGAAGSQLLPGLARPVPAALPLGRFGVPAVLEGFAASALGTDWLAGNPRQVVPNAGGLLVAKAVHAVGHVVVRQRFHVGPSSAARFAGSRRPTTEAGGTR